MTTTRQLHEQRVLAYSDEIAAIAAAVRLPLGYAEIFFRTGYLIYLCRKTLNGVDALEKNGCSTCTVDGCNFPVQHKLKAARDGMRLLLKHRENLPLGFHGQIRSIVDRLDDKLENYAIASDPDIKGMMAALSRRRHVHH